jgi:hypothetical protein
MITIEDLGGTQIKLQEEQIGLICGPYPNDVGRHTYVYAADPPLTVTTEAPEALVSRIELSPPMARLTRPNSTAVWINGSFVTAVRGPLKGDARSAKAIVVLEKLGPLLRQAVEEPIPDAIAALNAAGARV